MLTKKDYYKNARPEVANNFKVSESVKPISQDNLIGRENPITGIVKANPLLILLLVVGYFMLGMEYREVGILKGQGGTISAQANSVKTQPVAAISPQPAARPTAAVGSVDKVNEKDHIQGDIKARLALIVYSDLECPFSKRFQTTTVKQILDQYKDKIAVVYRHFPLDQIHSQTRKEAQATECAAKLGGNSTFWKLTNKIFETTPSNNGFDLTTLPALAVQAGLNKAAFQSCLNSGETAKSVEDQYQSGVRAGVNGTPGNFLVDTKTGSIQSIPGAVPFDQIKVLIDNVLTN